MLFRSRIEGEEARDRFNMHFARERKNLIEQKLGSSFLPPINEECKKRIDQIPVLKLDNETKKVISDRSKSREKVSLTIHAAFDPQNLAMP